MPSVGPPVSVVIVAHDEEDMLPACLESLSFADEIVIVLDRCTDRSKEIASGAGATIVEGAWPLEGPRRRAGIDAARHDWILEVDADERVPPELAAEIRTVLATAPDGCVKIPFLNCIGGKPVPNGWGAYVGIGAKWALFKRGYKTWGDQSVHPRIETRGARLSVENRMIHFVDEDLTDLFSRVNRYASLAARDWIAEGRPIGAAAPHWRRFVTRALKCYLGRKGYKEGVYGIALALAAGLYPLWTYLKARELHERGAG
jgi:glycosyltransferase involved in cell wall biosynthesis